MEGWGPASGTACRGVRGCGSDEVQGSGTSIVAASPRYSLFMGPPWLDSQSSAPPDCVWFGCGSQRLIVFGLVRLRCRPGRRSLKYVHNVAMLKIPFSMRVQGMYADTGLQVICNAPMYNLVANGAWIGIVAAQ